MWRREGNDIRDVPRRRIMAEKGLAFIGTGHVGLGQSASIVGR
jgi:hypothetical protein